MTIKQEIRDIQQQTKAVRDLRLELERENKMTIKRKKKSPMCLGKGIIYGYLGIHPRSIPLGKCSKCNGTGKVEL